MREDSIRTLRHLELVSRDMRDHLLTLYSIATGMKAKGVLEIGVRRGASTLAFLFAMKETHGKLYSVDIKPCETAIKRASELGLSEFWDFTVGDSRKVLKRFTTPVDICFIDGDHRLETVRSDFFNCHRVVREGGLILMHDSNCPPETRAKEGVEVHLVVEDIKKMPHLELVTLPYCNGLTIIRKLR